MTIVGAPLFFSFSPVAASSAINHRLCRSFGALILCACIFHRASCALWRLRSWRLHRKTRKKRYVSVSTAGFFVGRLMSIWVTEAWMPEFRCMFVLLDIFVFRMFFVEERFPCPVPVNSRPPLPPSVVLPPCCSPPPPPSTCCMLCLLCTW